MILNGKKSEILAEKYLLKKDYKIHFKNKRVGRYEVDLVCQDKDVIVFVEVKSLASNRIKNPYDAVTQSKQLRIIKVADIILKEQFPVNEARFDIISIIIRNGKPQFEHLKNAFTPAINTP
ncbi:MAG: YraN family protein [Bacteroidota bacterium]|nr:YraN family protein [Bacteroidota bacterium]